MIYQKIDWYTAMIHTDYLANILEKLDLSDFVDEYIQNGYETSLGWETKFVFQCDGISIYVNYEDVLTTQPEELFSKVFKNIRLDISGSGLDYLRGRGFNVDGNFTDINFWGDYEKDYHVTRCDFAFDFVNYQPGFVDKLLFYIQDCERRGELNPAYSRLTCIHRTSGIKYSYRCGDQRTIYLGTTRGKRLLRIYDKLLQYSKEGIIVKELPKAFGDEGSVDSWYRIEFQTRLDEAHKLLFGCEQDISRVLRLIFDQYKIKDKDGYCLECIQALFDWDKLPPIR